MRIIALGDIHEDPSDYARLEDEFRRSDLVLITGDLTNANSVAEAREIIEELRQYHDNVLAQIGNMDRLDVDDYLTSEGINLHGRGRVFGDVGVLGVGGSNFTPFSTPTELSEEEIKRIIEQGVPAVRPARTMVLVSHCPPYDTDLDLTRSGLHVGSPALREFILKEKPQVCICGHIHEAKGEQMLGSTRCVNPGPFFQGGYVIVEIEGDEVFLEIHTLNIKGVR